ncbi:hypothetical protein SteCoe_33480 [Stentor coeruleus]|uniref:Arrestin-like N-terminal domain-containing protein n=1 Tax=Stentor coeruleus TaxID=5963 RepID=A0A1R2AWN0_9CILI|nr:hypothetical protein SteCoe_33480 [Stentor coeruleus]
MSGNSSNTSKSGLIRIDLNNYVLKGGETIVGTINIYLSSSLPPSTLYFQFKGKEITQWEEYVSKNSRSAIVKHNKSSSICKVQYELIKWDHEMHPGGYTIPFSFQTPTGYPGSFKFVDKKTRANIVYIVSTSLENSQGILKDKVQIQMLQDAITIIPNSNIRKKIRLRSCCCSKGQIGLKILWPTIKFKNTELIECLLEIDNTYGLLPVTKVVTRISYTLLLKDKENNAKFITNSLSSKVYNITLGPEEALCNEDSLKISLDLKELDKKFSLLHSVKGELIECAFVVIAQVYVEGTCINSVEAGVSSYFVVEPVVFFQPAHLIPPADWNPKVFEFMNMVYDKKYEVQKNFEENFAREKGEDNNTCITIANYQNTEVLDNYGYISSETKR